MADSKLLDVRVSGLPNPIYLEGTRYELSARVLCHESPVTNWRWWQHQSGTSGSWTPPVQIKAGSSPDRAIIETPWWFANRGKTRDLVQLSVSVSTADGYFGIGGATAWMEHYPEG